MEAVGTATTTSTGVRRIPYAQRTRERNSLPACKPSSTVTNIQNSGTSPTFFPCTPIPASSPSEPLAKPPHPTKSTCLDVPNDRDIGSKYEMV